MHGYLAHMALGFNCWYVTTEVLCRGNGSWGHTFPFSREPLKTCGHGFEQPADGRFWPRCEGQGARPCLLACSVLCLILLNMVKGVVDILRRLSQDQKSLASLVLEALEAISPPRFPGVLPRSI